MITPSLQIAALLLLSIVGCTVHIFAKFIVHQGFGLIAIVILFASLKPLSRYLD